MPKVGSEVFDVVVMVHHQTEKAVLVSDDGDRSRAVWVPKSQCELEHQEGQRYVLTAETSLLEEKGLV